MYTTLQHLARDYGVQFDMLIDPSALHLGTPPDPVFADMAQWAQIHGLPVRVQIDGATGTVVVTNGDGRLGEDRRHDGGEPGRPERRQGRLMPPWFKRLPPGKTDAPVRSTRLRWDMAGAWDAFTQEVASGLRTQVDPTGEDTGGGPDSSTL